MINTVVVYGPSGSDETGSGCWIDTLRVAPNGELDTFYTDAGANWLKYSSPPQNAAEHPARVLLMTHCGDLVSAEGRDQPAIQ